MNTDEARHILTTYAAYHSQRDEAIHTLKRDGVTIADIVRLSGLSREGIRKILDRQETPILTVATDATAGALEVHVQDLYPGQVAPGVGGGVYPEVTLPGDKANQLIAALQARGHKAWADR